MSKQLQTFTMLPLSTLAVANTPQRLSATDVWVRAFVAEAPKGNQKDMYISDTEVNAGSLNRHTLVPGALRSFNSDMYGNLDAQINLRLIWISGQRAGDVMVVSYFPINTEIC